MFKRKWTLNVIQSNLNQILRNKSGNKLKLSSNIIRQSFFDYFINEHKHEFYPSSSVKPLQYDKSLLFVNAGMNQFKPIFLDQLDQFESLRNLSRVVNSQKCIRVGGKHCDLDTVGTDFSHHTFFEMLGNWSFNDYFKTEACFMAWNLLTNGYQINPRRLFVTIFSGNEELQLEPDFETYEIWRSIGVPKNNIIFLGIADNFWEMGQTGPCGICTEIHYLLNEPPADQVNLKNFMLNNSVEIWNLVFIQYSRDQHGKLNRLNKNFVDTGMGLERIAFLLQNVSNNYATDLFTPYFDNIVKLTKWPEYSHQLKNEKDIAYRILADHSRMASVAIADGIEPDDRGAGYLLRRVIRRAIDSIKNISKTQSLPINVTESEIFAILANTTIEILGDTFPELKKESERIFKTLNEEIKLYATTFLRNTLVMKYSNLLNLTIIENNDHNESELLKKLNEINDNIDNIHKKLSENFIDSQNDFEIQKKAVRNIRELISINGSHRFGLSSKRIDTKFEALDIKVAQLEEEIANILEKFVQDFQYKVNDTIISGDNFNIVSIEDVNFIKNIDYNFLMKISLDIYGTKPLALILKTSDSILLQLSVPSLFRKKLQADSWFKMINELFKFNNLENKIKLESIPTKRIEKIVKYRFILCNQVSYSEIFKFLHSYCHCTAEKYFEHCK